MRAVARFPRGLQSKPFTGSSRQALRGAVPFSAMAFEFTEYDHEPQAQPSFARGGGPPSKFTSAGVLDPPVPPKRPPGPLPMTPASMILRIFAGLLLAGLAVMTFLLLFGKH